MAKHYLYKVSILNKKNSHPLESISYYSGENQYDISNSKTYISNTVDNVIWNKIIVPNKDSLLHHDLPEYLKFRTYKKDVVSNARNILWQNVYNREKRDDAQFSRIFELSIPSFINKEDAINTLILFSKNLIEEGMIVDCSLHSRKNNLNGISLFDTIKEVNIEEKNDKLIDYTGYLICTLRTYKEGRFFNKNRDWNDKKKMEFWRYKWVELLSELINNNPLTKEQKIAWEEKLQIYPEYQTIKNLNQIKSSLEKHKI